MMKKLSVIIPVYNVEKYLPRCLDNVVSQINNDVEIIIVNDGSSDDSYLLAKKYEEKNKNIYLYSKPNGGLSSARNFGLKKSKGEYILFVDSDDSLASNAIEVILEKISSDNADVISFGYNFIKKKCILEYKRDLDSDKLSGEEFMMNELVNRNMFMAAWSYVYKKGFLEENSLEFKEGILHEDEEFTPRVLLKAKRVSSIFLPLYNYYENENTITTKKNKEKNARDLLATLKELDEIYNSVSNEELKRLLKDSLLEKYLSNFISFGVIEKKYTFYIDKKFLYKKGKWKNNIIKKYIFILSPYLYYYLHKVSK